MKHFVTFLAFLMTVTSVTVGADAFEYFIARDGDRLMDGDVEYRFFGANMPGLILPYDYFYGVPERMVLPTPWEQEDAFKTLRQMGLTCVRTWNLPIAFPDEQGAENFKTLLAPRQFNEKAFVVVDRMLDLARRYQVRVIFPLTADYGDMLGGVGAYAAHRGKKPVEFYTDPQLKDDYKATVDFVLNRVNTVNGVRYRDDKTILAWQFGNELDRTKPGEEIQRAWQAEMAAYIKSLDPNHLLAYGRRFFPDEPDPNVDIVVEHYYPYRRGGNWETQIVEDRRRTKGKRPLILTEFGLEPDPSKFAKLLDDIIGQGISGAMIWSMASHHRDGGFWHHGIFTVDGMKNYHWPGFPENDAIKEREILRALRDAAYRIRGLETPPIVAPEPPELLPFDEIPLMSWRGSVGATGYRVEKSEKPHGPWKTVADDLSDGDVVYRPNFADAGARPGETWYYRVIAKNEGGESPPSNVVGPVAVKRGVLVDEMKNRDLFAEHSSDIEQDNKANYYYLEYYYRIRGKTGDWIIYRAPDGTEWDGFSLIAWSNKAAPTFRLSASSDRKNWTPIETEPTVVPWIPYYPKPRWKDVRATESRYRASALPGKIKYLKIEWQKPSLLDRAELLFRNESK